MKYIPKGQFGYIRSEKRRRAIIASGLLLIPLIVYVIGLLVTGTRQSIVTVVAIVGTLPACRAIVAFIMMVMRKPMDEAAYEEIRAHEGTLMTVYELYLTTYDKSAMVDAFAICGCTVVGLTTDPKCEIHYMEDHITKIMRANGYVTNVTILKDRQKYIERMDSMNAHAESLRNVRFKPDSRYPGYGIEELIRETLLAISL